MKPGEVLEWVRTVGVPAASAFYVLIRLEAKLDKLAETVHQVNVTIARTFGGEPP